VEYVEERWARRLAAVNLEGLRLIDMCRSQRQAILGLTYPDQPIDTGLIPCSCASSPATIYCGCGICSRRSRWLRQFQTPYTFLIPNKTSDVVAAVTVVLSTGVGR
jgi:hypothetical protein